MKKDKQVWIWWTSRSGCECCILMNKLSKEFLYKFFPDGEVDLVMKDGNGNIKDECKLNDLYNEKPITEK